MDPPLEDRSRPIFQVRVAAITDRTVPTLIGVIGRIEDFVLVFGSF